MFDLVGRVVWLYCLWGLGCAWAQQSRPGEITQQPEVVAAVPASRSSLSGVLLRKGMRSPLVGLMVKASWGKGAFEHEAFTDEHGRFVIEGLPPGALELVVEEPGFEVLKDTFELGEGQILEVQYFLGPQGFEETDMVIVGQRVRRVVTVHQITAEEALTAPGTQGDILKAVPNLPGAARPPFGSGDLVLRGGGYTQAVIEGQDIPYAFHFGDIRSTISADLVETLAVYPGNYGVEFGRGNGGFVDIQLRRPSMEGVHGNVDVNLFDAGAFVEGPIGTGGSLAVGFRRSYIDVLFPVVMPKEAVEDFRTAPRYFDGQMLYDHRWSGHTVRWFTYGGGDRLVLLIDEPSENDPGLRGRLDNRVEWVGSFVDWEATVAEGVRHTASLGYLYTHSRQSLGDDLRLDFDLHQVTFRDALSVRLSEAVTWRVGLDHKVLYTWADVLAVFPPKEGDAPPPLSAGDPRQIERTFWSWEPALWTEAELRWGDLTLIPGLRVDHYSLTDEILFQPRLTARYRVNGATTLKGAVGQYTQPPDLDEVDDTFGTSAINAEQSLHTSLGVERRFGDHLSVDVTGFYKGFDQLITADRDDPDTRYRNQGIGRAYGLEALIRFGGHPRFNGWLAYTLQRSERRDRPGVAWRAFDQDQTHNLVLVGRYRLTRDWSIGGRWRYVTGNPQTEYDRAIFDSDNDVYVPIVAGQTNTGRLPAFHQLDLRIDRQWLFDTWQLTAYLDLQNAYNRANAEAFTYNYDYTRRDTLGGLPLLPSFGLRGEF
ncbi:MAG: carboxypeptidase regulatory-like domain-containing protein [Bradymonadia bacterium]